MTDYVIVDIATAPLPDAGAYLEEPEPPSNYVNPDKIAEWIAKAKAKLLEKAALDPDLCRITCVGLWTEDVKEVHVLRDDTTEGEIIACVGELLAPANAVAVTFGGRTFDLAVLQRRALYLGQPFPKLNLDRYRSPHVDLCELLADGEIQRKHSLDFYCLRHGWDDLNPKPLSGADEAKVFETGEWDRLAASVRRDVEAVRRLAAWAGVLPGEGA